MDATLASTYDQFLRRTNLSLNTQPSTINLAFRYDPASRLQSVSDGVNGAIYTYLANSPLVSQIAFTNNGATRMTTTKQYDLMNRLTNIVSTPSGSGRSAVSFVYTYNDANQRTRATLADNSYWDYGYDYLGQLTNAVKRWPDTTLVAG